MVSHKFYVLTRRERHKYRRKLAAALKKRGCPDEDFLRIVDAVAGRSGTGKETAAKEILALLSDGADWNAVSAYVDSLDSQFIDIPFR